MKKIFFTLLTTTVIHTYVQAQLDVQVQRVPVDSNTYYNNNNNQNNNQGTVQYQERIQNLPPGARVNIQESRTTIAPNRSMDSNTSNTSQPQYRHAERTLSIIKPDAVEGNHIGDIISKFEKSGLRIAAIKIANLSPEQAGQFYQVHRNRPFYPDLVKFMSSGPVVIMVLEGDNAIAKNRELMGATDPQKAASGTIRADFAQSVTRNAVHGSDSPESAEQEVLFFFKPNEIVNRY